MDRQSLLETAFDSFPEGLVVMNSDENVELWNAAAEAITGYAISELAPAIFPSGLMQLIKSMLLRKAGSQSASGELIRIRHKLGHELRVIARGIALPDKAGETLGGLALFHSAERLEALPHGDSACEMAIASTRAEFEERLYTEFEDFERGGESLGILWVSVDQAHCLRKTHGVAACHEMLDKVQHALASGLRPSEEMARWGEEDFLILAHERSDEMLARHASTLAGLARTSDFRWWGDRITLTVSVGAAQAVFKQPLSTLLERARKALETSIRAGGNRVTCAQREQEGTGPVGEDLICTPS